MESGGADGVGHRAGLEGPQVTVDGRGCVANLCLDALEFVGELGLLLVDLVDGEFDGGFEQVQVVVGADEGVDDGFSR